MDLHQRIRNLRKRRGMTGLKLARRAGVSPSYVSLIEHGEKVPSERVAVRLARALGDREDLYRAWAATSRMDDETRRAVMALGAPGAPDAARAILVPLLAGGRRPADPDRLRSDEIEMTLRIDARLLPQSRPDGLLALRIDADNARLSGGAVLPGDVVVIDRRPGGHVAGPLAALAVDGRLHVARVAREQDRLVVTAGSHGEPLLARLRAIDGVADLVFGAIVWRAHLVGGRATGRFADH